MFVRVFAFSWRNINEWRFKYRRVVNGFDERMGANVNAFSFGVYWYAELNNEISRQPRARGCVAQRAQGTTFDNFVMRKLEHI